MLLLVMVMFKQSVILFLFTVIFVLGIFSQENDGLQPYYLESFRFIPIWGHCYQLYLKNDVASTCRRKPDLKNQSCIQWLKDKGTCLGLVTPTNESVMFRCISHIRFDNCFEIYGTDQKISPVCPQILEGRSIGITTPDNFTIILHDSLCRTSVSTVERMVYDDFVNNFSLDVETRSCYKVYNTNQLVSPYSCLDSNIFQSCVFSVSDCTYLLTQNNEALILHCTDQSHNTDQKNCFYLYTADNQTHLVCQEKVEERCVGLVTPSNLTILFECFFCSDYGKFSFYNPAAQKRHRQFIKTYITNEYLGINSYLHYTRYRVFNKSQSFEVSVDWIPKTSCVGMKLNSNETVILECIVEIENEEDPTCFALVTSEGEKESVCLKVLNESCVGLVTPMDITVVLECYATANMSKLQDYNYKWMSILDSLVSFISNRRKFRVGEIYNAYRETKGNRKLIQTENKVFNITAIHDQPGCIGILTASETIILECLGLQQNGCFNVTQRESGIISKVASASTEVESVCVKVLDSHCIGIITSDDWHIQLFCASSEPHQQPGSAVTYTIPSNLQPARQRRNILNASLNLTLSKTNQIN